jgi:arylsulfatase A-like enzyme/Tfp pilus assembly protein PilF
MATKDIMRKKKKTMAFFLVLIILLGVGALLLFKLLSPLRSSDMNIVLFTIDTLRADHLECYGYRKVKTPHINRLADEGILFKYAIAQAPLTLPSHSSIFTGSYPLHHGVRDNAGFYLDEAHTTLAEVLKNYGYSTAAFVGAFVLDSRWGIHQGFDHYYDNFDLTKYKTPSLDSVQRRGDEVLAEAYEWLEQNRKNKCFVWIHLYDPHTPYNPPEPYKSQYSGTRFSLYDGEIAYVDQLIGEFREFMEERELLDRTAIILTADHGESLGEHKENAHGFFIYDSAIRVPLIIRFPGKALAETVIDDQVRSVDIMPTLLHLVNAEAPQSVQGRSLLSLIMGKNDEKEAKAYSETFWPRYHYGWSELKSIRKGKYKFIDAPKPELYDVIADPAELTNIVDMKASSAIEMKRELDALIQTYTAEGLEETGPERIDNDSLIKLQALGYIGSFRTSPKKTGERLADPKDKIELYNEIKVAQFLVTEDKTEEAINKIQDVLEKDPSVLEARYILGNIYSKQDRFDDAIEEFRKALEVDPDYYEAIFGLAMAYKNAGRQDEAIIGFKRLLDIERKDTKPFLHLGDIYEERGDLDVAQRYLESGVELDPESPVLHNNLGAVYLKKKKFSEAEKEIRTALGIKRHIPLRNAHFNMALLHEARGEFDLAISEYRKEQETAPFNHKPDFNLGLLHAKFNDVDKAIKEFKSCIEKNDAFAGAYVFLAKAYMDSNRDLNEAEQLARKGLSLKAEPQTMILGHFVLADILNRQGKSKEAQNHVNQAKELQKRL